MEVSVDTGMSLNLNDDERRLMDEISLSAPTTAKDVPVRKPAPARPLFRRPPPPPPGVSRGGGGPVDPAEMDMNMFVNPTKSTLPQQPPVEMWDGGEEVPDVEGGGGGEMPSHMGGQPSGPSEGYKTIEDEKADLLNKIARLAKRGMHTSSRLTAYSDIEEIRTEYKRLTYAIESERAIRFQRRILIACITGLEFLNKRFDPFDLQLDGWSENVMENVEDYDSVFEELYNKYNAKVNVAPEVKLIMMIGGSAMMFHLTNSMFKSAVPDMSKVMKQNPELLKNMMEAVQRTAAAPPTTTSTTAPGARREMRGPSGTGGLDMSALFGMMGPPPPVSTREPREEDEVSDIVSVDMSTDTREVEVRPGGGKKKTASRKKEVVL
jgi:Family of unknown function (DUF5767)